MFLIVAHARDELYSVDEEHLEKGLADISPVSAELAPDVLHVVLVPERLAVVGVVGAHAQKHVLDAQRQAEGHLLLQFHEAAVGGEDGEQDEYAIISASLMRLGLFLQRCHSVHPRGSISA